MILINFYSYNFLATKLRNIYFSHFVFVMRLSVVCLYIILGVVSAQIATTLGPCDPISPIVSSTP